MDRLTIYLESIQFQGEIFSLAKAFYPDARISCLPILEAELDEGDYYLLREEGNQVVGEWVVEGKPQQRRSKSLDLDSRLNLKNHLKYVFYQLLSEKTGVTLPWGTLTGIRPIHFIEENVPKISRLEQEEYLRNHFFISQGKIHKAYQVLEEENRILSKVNYQEGYSLYIGIPYCPSICLYCSFGSSEIRGKEKEKKAYLMALMKEIRAVSQMMKHRPLHTIYIGGGTPIILEEEELAMLLETVRDSFDLSHLYEYSFEAGRPELFSKGKLAILKQYGVNRISINPQTMNDETLALIGRGHTSLDILRAYEMAIDFDFDCLNMDIILGLPGEGMEALNHTFKALDGLEFDSLTVHSLALKRASRLSNVIGQYPKSHWQNSANMMQATEDFASRHRMRPYYLYRQKNMAGNFENTGYAKMNKACYYNIFIMEEKQSIIGCGVKSSTRILSQNEVIRQANVKDVSLYIERLDEIIYKKEEALKMGGML